MRNSIQNDPQFESLHKLLSFWKEFKWLANLHVTDFFAENLWEKIPSSWREAVETNNLNLSQLLNLSKVTESECPKDLLEFARKCSEFNIKKNYGDTSESYEISHLLNTGMIPKKKMEVGVMAKMVSDCAINTGCKTVIDIGSGQAREIFKDTFYDYFDHKDITFICVNFSQGYLSRVLAYQYGLDVFAFDGTSSQTEGSKKLNESTLKKIGGKKGKVDTLLSKNGFGSINYTTLFIDENSKETFKTTINNYRKSDNCDTKKWLICGLHACGNLTDTMIRTFINTDASALVVVGCCYNLINEGVKGFPISEYFKREEIFLGKNTLKLACQSPEKWEKDIKLGSNSFRNNYFRALLHYLMIDSNLILPTDEFPKLGKLEKGDYSSFAIYAKAAINKLKQLLKINTCTSKSLCSDISSEMEVLEITFTDDSIPKTIVNIKKYEDLYGGNGEKYISAFCLLQFAIAPVIETLVATDRILCLKESGANAKIIPLFDSSLSPRSLAIVSNKFETKTLGNEKFL
ncbi:hypothetical protein BB559_003981 [Furculomyces boomerangus]|uniref:Methyltransferase domain-containing protein n=1 Tax=Furculomyces boomerangus TaxID=61424 RepID=A0A2T9YHM6_9FUNG|nr:hypothetical protein BB559_003981 [Furculomyces boomerangus]